MKTPAALFLLAFACVSLSGRLPVATNPALAAAARAREPHFSLAPLVELPRVEGPHGTPVVWWYLNGHLQSEDGARYAFHFAIFRLSGTRRFKGDVAHIGFTNLADGTYVADERCAPILLTGAAESRIDFDVNDWRFMGENGEYTLETDTADLSLRLTTMPTKPPLAHDHDGIVDYGEAGESFYYSWPRLEIAGSLHVGSSAVEVTGTAWFDHQWGDFHPWATSWEWCGLHLDDGSDLMLYTIRDANGVAAEIGTLIDPLGNVQMLNKGDCTITNRASWISPRTGINYPSGWQVSVPSLNLHLTLEPIVEDAEFPGTGLLPINYGEGEVIIHGRSQGRPATGRGFGELVGYR